MIRFLIFVAIVVAVFYTRLGAPVLHYLQDAAQAITRSFAP
ncbi:MAG TPA: hypothetical protein VJT32_01150 [bacterium]|nr:hypothetical protein [bacterium]